MLVLLQASDPRPQRANPAANATAPARLLHPAIATDAVIAADSNPAGRPSSNDDGGAGVDREEAFVADSRALKTVCGRH